jgi:5-oxoprolinase (ATP-hydrolysing) subunit A
MKWIDLNADLGEGGTEDAALLGLVSSANIACGGHAGDAGTMRRTVALAQEAGVAMGAHPGYEDREHFGRRAMILPFEKVTVLVRQQVAALNRVVLEAGGRLHHVKPHGALYNQASRDPLLAAALVRGIVEVSPELILYALPQSALAVAGKAAGLPVYLEGFADRRYREDGSLMPRGEPGAVIKEVAVAVTQALEIISKKSIQTLCVHGDGATAVEILRDLRRKLDGAGVRVPRKSHALAASIFGIDASKRWV